MFIPAGGYLLSAVEFGSGPQTLAAHGGWVGSWAEALDSWAAGMA